MRRRWPRRRGAAAASGVAFALVLLAGCDDFPGLRAAGVTLSDDAAAPEFLFVLCPGQRLERLQVVRRVGDSPFDGDDVIIWDIASRSGSRTGEIVFGVVPPGFLERVPAPRALAPSQEVVAVFDATSASRFGVSFDPEALRAGEVVTFEGSREPVSKFRDEAASRCP